MKTETENTTADSNSNGATDTARTIGRAIRTRYRGPTDTKGSRVRAWIADDGKPLASVVVSWNYELDADGNHEAAARAVLAKLRKGKGGHHWPRSLELVGAYLGNGEHAFAMR